MTDDRRAELRAATLRGVRWISISRILVEITALAATVILARLIPPADFGRAAVALIIFAFALILGPAGLTASLVQREVVTRRHLEAASFFTLGLGAVLTAITVALLPAARSVFGAVTAELILLASPAWLISGFGAVSQAMLQRDLRFRRIALVESVSVLAGAAVGVGSAVAGLDGEALVLAALTTTAVATALAVVASPPVRPWPTRRATGELGAFSGLVALSSLTYAAFRNVDYALLGARMSPADVGYYWRAYQLGVDYQAKVSQIMLRVSFPIYSRSENISDLRQLRMRIVRVHAIVLVPLLAGFAAFAPVLIPFLFGPAWSPAIVPAQIMAIAGIGHALVTGTGPLLVAIGRPGLLLTWNLVELVAYAVMIYVLAPSGLVVVSAGVAAFSVLGVILTQVVLLKPLIGLPHRAALAEVWPGIVVGVCLFASLLTLRVGLEETAMANLAILGVCSIAGIVLYVTLLRICFPDTLRDLVSIVRRTVAPGRPLRAEPPYIASD